jgi:hypothetical protein
MRHWRQWRHWRHLVFGLCFNQNHLYIP